MNLMDWYMDLPSIFFLSFPVMFLYCSKSLNLVFFMAGSNSTDFNYQVRYLSPIRHRNLVTLLGYCQENNLQFLVYEHVPNKNISSHLYGNSLSSHHICFYLPQLTKVFW